MRSVLLTAAALFLGLVLSGGAKASQLDDGKRAWNDGDFSRAMTLLRPLAEQGNSTAQFQVGVMFSGGQGVKQDLPESIKWFRLAAEQGNADAQYSLGQEYAIGDGIEKNLEEAYFWLDLASGGYEAAGRSTAANAKALRDRVSEKLAPDKLRQAQQRSKAWAPPAK